MNLKENIEDAKRSLAETAIGSPYIFHEYVQWEGAKRAMVEAANRLAITERVWLSRLAPALKDPLLREVAKRKGLIP